MSPRAGSASTAKVAGPEHESLGVHERIVEAASILFRVKGYDKTSVGDIGAAVGLGGPAIYYYVGSKANLLFEALALPMQRQIDLCRAAIVGKEPAEQVRAYVSTIVTFLLDLPLVSDFHGEPYVSMGTLAKSLEPERRGEILRMLGEPVRDLRAVVEAGIKDGSFRKVEPTPAVFALLGIAENVMWFRRESRLTAEQVAELYGDLAVRTILA